MAITVPTIEEITDRLFSKLKQQTGITSNLEASTIGMLLKLSAAEIYSMWLNLEEADKQSNLTTATGSSLDNWGFWVGTPRKTAIPASTEGYARVVHFTNTSGGTVTITTGTRVFNSSKPQIAYFTTEGGAVGNGSSIDLHVTAADTGEIYNVAIGELNASDFPSAGIQVTNLTPIQNGQSLESDDSYRERILQAFKRRNTLTVDGVNALVRSVAGVRDAYVLNKKRGDGSFDVIVVPYVQSDPAAVVSDVRSILTPEVPAGIDFEVYKPVYRFLDVTVSLTFKPNFSGNKQSIRDDIKAQLIARMDNLPLEDGSGNGTLYTISLFEMNLPDDVIQLNVQANLDGAPLTTNGQISLEIGEKIYLRSISVS